MSILVEAKKLVKRYGDRTVVNQVSLSVQAGEVVAIVGPNGAGKSTTLEMILGMRQPDGGDVLYWAPDYQKQIGVQLQSSPIFGKMTVLENVHLFASFYGNKMTNEEVDNLLKKFHLTEVRKVVAAKLSGGQRKRLSIALTVAHNPKLVFLDEPTSDLDPRARLMIRDIIQNLADDGKAVVFTSHDMAEVGKLAHRVILFDQGQIQAEGTPDELLAAHQVESLEELFLKLTTEPAYLD